MRRDSKQLILAGALVLLTSAPAWSAVPNWVKQASSQPLGTYPADTNAVVLFDDTTFTVTNPQEYVEHERRVVKILRPDGRDEGHLYASFRGGEKVLSIHAWAIDAAGREYELKDKDFGERSDYSFILYSDYRYRYAQAPAANPGSVIAFEYEVRRAPMFNQFYWFLQPNRNPVIEARFHLELPAGWEYKTAWGNLKPVEPTGTGNSWQWMVRDLPGIKEEDEMPAFRAVAPHMALTYFPPGGAGNFASWGGMGKWYGDLVAERRVTTPAITEAVKELIAGKTTFDQKLRALTSFLQTEVRYVAIEIGIGGFQPHAAGDVFRLRYGDCKDKANLLSVILQEAGIRSSHLVIHTDRGIAVPGVPSVYSFNHMVLAIELPEQAPTNQYHSVTTAASGKRYLIFDPTDEYTPVGELRAELQNTYALLVTDAGGELIRTPIADPDTSRLVRKGTFTLQPDGTISGEVVEERSGDSAWEYRISMLPATELQRRQRVERFLNRSLKDFTLQDPQFEQLNRIDQDVVARYKFSSPQYAQAAGPMLLVRPRVLGEKSFTVERKPRQYPYEMNGTSRETDAYEIEVPAGYTVDDLPQPVKIDVGFASYESKIAVKGSKIEYSRELVVRDLSVPPERVADLRRFEGAIGADESGAVVLKRVQ